MSDECGFGHWEMCDPYTTRPDSPLEQLARSLDEGFDPDVFDVWHYRCKRHGTIFNVMRKCPAGEHNE